MTAQEAEALKGLADLALPGPVSWLPQTWGWAVVGAVLLVLLVWGLVRWRRRWKANRYRAEAVAEIAALEATLGDRAARAPALAAMPPIVKRAALAAWPRSEVARLSGPAWVKFLRAHGELPKEAARLLEDAEYRPVGMLAAVSEAEARACARALRAWVKEHRASA